VEVPEQPLYFNDTVEQRPLTSLQNVCAARHSKSPSRHQLTVPASTSLRDITRDDVTRTDEDVTPCSSTKSGRRRYNLRRLNELPYHLVRCRRTDQLLDEVVLCAGCAAATDFFLTRRAAAANICRCLRLISSCCQEFKLSRILATFHNNYYMPSFWFGSTCHHFRVSLSAVVSFSLGILHEWMKMQPSSNLLQRIGGDHRAGRAQRG